MSNPDLNPSSNTTEAPTNQLTIDSVLPKIPEDQLEFVTMVDQHWNLHGQILTSVRASLDWGLPNSDYERLSNSPLVIAALKERGIDLNRELKRAAVEPESEEEKRAKQLSPLQLVVANSLIDLTDQRSDKKKLQDLGVSTATYQRWLRDKNFSTYLSTMSERLLGDSQHEASLALLDKVKAGDLPSIKFYMEYTGRFTSKADGGGQEVKDIHGLLVKVLEIIVEECDGPTAMIIADRMKQATAIHSTAVDLTSNIVVPQVAAMRDMTPEMLALQEKTSGGDV